MVNKLFNALSQATLPLNRLLAWIDFGIHYVSGYLLYYLVGGYKPQFHTRPASRKNGEVYAPSILVTGASQGIGLATSLYLASKGYTVFASVKNEEELERIKHEIETRDVKLDKGSIRPLIMDVLSPSSISSAVDEINSAIGDSTMNPLVGVINNAGVCMISPMELTPVKAVRDLFELDFWAYINVIKAFMPLIKKNQGRFINIGSYAGFVNPPMFVAYSAAKAAIEGMTRAWRFELKPFGVGMTSIRPGWTRTHGIGPKIAEAWETYYDQVQNGKLPAGVDSLGRLVDADGTADQKEKDVYLGMMTKWHQLVMAAADGAVETAEAVATTVYDAMTDPFLQPYYTVGYDALLGQMWRDLTPESLYEVTMYRVFEGKVVDKTLSAYKPARLKD